MLKRLSLSKPLVDERPKRSSFIAASSAASSSTDTNTAETKKQEISSTLESVFPHQPISAEMWNMKHHNPCMQCNQMAAVAESVQFVCVSIWTLKWKQVQSTKWQAIKPCIAMKIDQNFGFG